MKYKNIHKKTKSCINILKKISLDMQLSSVLVQINNKFVAVEIRERKLLIRVKRKRCFVLSDVPVKM